MAIDLNSVREVEAKAAPVTEIHESSSSATQIDVQSATLVAPQAAPTNSLDPLAGAGVTLTKIVLLILSCVLFLLISALIYQEKRFSDLTTDAYRAAFSDLVINRVNNVQNQQIASILDLLQAAENVNEQEKKIILLKNALQLLSKLNGLATENKSFAKLVQEIQSVIDTPTQPLSALTLGSILSQAKSVLTAETTTSVEHLKARQDLLKAYLDATNATRDFWLKIAQMILVNLILPVLTALLGYVFGSKQASKQ
ncbi:MAG: hypothetical protein V4495_19870 [Pseudomonadota bacterium]